MIATVKVPNDPSAIKATVELVDGPGILLYRVVVRLPNGAVLTRRPCKAKSEAEAMCRTLDGATNAVFTAIQWRSR